MDASICTFKLPSKTRLCTLKKKVQSRVCSVNVHIGVNWIWLFITHNARINSVPVPRIKKAELAENLGENCLLDLIVIVVIKWCIGRVAWSVTNLSLKWFHNPLTGQRHPGLHTSTQATSLTLAFPQRTADMCLSCKHVRRAQGSRTARRVEELLGPPRIPPQKTLSVPCPPLGPSLLSPLDALSSHTIVISPAPRARDNETCTASAPSAEQF